ncbi:MAG: DUF2306 domain-containing protein [Bryobacteraceae bacterium]
MAGRIKKRELPAVIWLAWCFMAMNAVGTAVVALRYGLPKVPFPTPLPNFYDRHGWLVAHATISAVALLVGPWQFRAGFRERYWSLHRVLGQIYCLAVLGGWITSLPIAAHAQTGLIATTGFLALGAVWVSTTGAGYIAVRKRRVESHQGWMIRSYSATFAAVTLRSYLPLLLVAGVPLQTCYPLVAWLCWVPNLAVAEWLIHRRRVPEQSGIALIRAMD